MDGVPGDPEHPGLLKATARMTDGSSRLADGTVALNAGIKGDPADPANPGLLTGSAALASGASELSAGNTKLASGSTQLSTGADKLADGNAQIAAGTGTLYSSAAAVSPSNMINGDVAVAVGLVTLLGLGAVGAYLVAAEPPDGTGPNGGGPPGTASSLAVHLVGNANGPVGGRIPPTGPLCWARRVGSGWLIRLCWILLCWILLSGAAAGSGQQVQQRGDLAAGEPGSRLSAAVEPDAQQAGRRRAFRVEQPVVAHVQRFAGPGAEPADAFEVDRGVRLGHADGVGADQDADPSSPAASSFTRW